jgi:hypothetical protein
MGSGGTATGVKTVRRRCGLPTNRAIFVAVTPTKWLAAPPSATFSSPTSGWLQDSAPLDPLITEKLEAIAMSARRVSTDPALVPQLLPPATIFHSTVASR